jgi:hypothetical protein
MKIKELHKDVQRYLENDCYCQHEIYSFDGFCYMLFTPEDECTFIDECNEFIACISGTQVIAFFKKDDKITDALRYDATENNIKLTVNILKTGKPDGKFNVFDTNTDAEDIAKILSMCDLIIRD